MAKIVELCGASHVFTLQNGSTLRIMSHKTKTVRDSLISDEMRRAESMKIISIINTADTSADTKKKEG